MAWYGWLIIGLTIVLSSIAGGLKFFFIDASNLIEKKIRNGEKLFCRFKVIDKQTKQELFYGEKMRNRDGLAYIGKFRRYGIEPIYTFVTCVDICGTECEVTYWASARKVKDNYQFATIMTEAGMKLLRNVEKAVFI